MCARRRKPHRIHYNNFVAQFKNKNMKGIDVQTESQSASELSSGSNYFWFLSFSGSDFYFTYDFEQDQGNFSSWKTRQLKLQSAAILSM